MYLNYEIYDIILYEDRLFHFDCEPFPVNSSEVVILNIDLYISFLIILVILETVKLIKK